jgi:glycosyltransferase involved in cell wall biosynthesis
MRILRIVSSGYEQGGVENALVISNEILRQRGHDVRTISSNARGDLDHYSDYEFKGIPSSGILKILTTTFNFSAYRLTKKVASDFKPDIVTLHTLHQPSPSVLYALKKYRSVLCIHGPEGYTKALTPWLLTAADYKNESFELKDLTPVGKIHYLYFTLISRPLFMRGLKKVKYAISYSKYTQRMMLNEGIESHYIPEGVTLYDFNEKKSVTNTLGFAGRLEKNKGVDYLINSMPTIVASLTNAKLLIAGEGGYQDNLVKLVDSLNLNNSVTFLGRLTRDEMKKFYKDIDIFVMASSPAETFGKVGVEAMSAGKPVLAPNIGGISDWLEDGVNGYFIDKEDPAQIAKTAMDILNRPTELRLLGLAGRKTAEKFTMQSYTEKHEAYFKQIISGAYLNTKKN